MLLLAAALTQGIFPRRYRHLWTLKAPMVALLNLRNGVLGVLLVWLLRRLPRLLTAGELTGPGDEQAGGPGS